MILGLFEVIPHPQFTLEQPAQPGSPWQGQKPLAVLYARKEMGWRAEEF